MSIAVIGPEGAGKTEYCERFGKKILHAVPRTAKLQFPKNKAGRVVHEFIIAIEKLTVNLKVKFIKHDNIMLDNCFIDSEVYGHLWSIKTGSSLPLIIARFGNTGAYKPETIHQLIVEPSKAKSEFQRSEDDIDLLNSIYIFTLKRHGYKQYNERQYERGVMIVWKKDSNSLSTVERRKT